MEVRVRFAPSPTGYLHVGGARTALFNYLFAKKHGGKFILRIEDTDRTRFQEGALDEIFTSLRWMGLNWDEGPEVGGDCGPYYQSERLDLYKKYADELVAKGLAYPCFCTSERLTALREEQEKSSGKPQASGYDRHCRDLDPAEAQKRIVDGEAYVIRLRIPDGETITFNDTVRGEISFESDTLDDFVLLKTDGFPTYHLANVIDDHDMKISHVLRGDEWITSAPKHELLYRAFGWNPPVWAHLPVILSETGGKLSKRKGAASVMDYYREGILSEALFNFLALLGWNPGDDREIMTIQEMIDAFSLERVSAKGSVFDSKKLEWMNGQYLAEEDSAKLVKEVLPALKKLDVTISEEKLLPILDLMKSRFRKVTEIAEGILYFFKDPESYPVDNKKVKKALRKEGVTTLLGDLKERFSALDNFTQEACEKVLHDYMEEKELGFGAVGLPTRLAISGQAGGPSLHEIMVILGKEVTIGRIDKLVSFISNTDLS